MREVKDATGSAVGDYLSEKSYRLDSTMSKLQPSTDKCQAGTKMYNQIIITYSLSQQLHQQLVLSHFH